MGAFSQQQAINAMREPLIFAKQQNLLKWSDNNSKRASNEPTTHKKHVGYGHQAENGDILQWDPMNNAEYTRINKPPPVEINKAFSSQIDLSFDPQSKQVDQRPSSRRSSNKSSTCTKGMLQWQTHKAHNKSKRSRRHLRMKSSGPMIACRSSILPFI